MNATRSPNQNTDESWANARRELTRSDGSVNIAWAATDRHVDAGRGDDIALKWLSKSGEAVSYTYADLLRRSSLFANALTQAGFGPGARLYTLLGRVPELYVAMLGTLRGGGVFTPLFSAFGPEPIRTRVAIGRADVLVTTTALYRRKVAPWRAQEPSIGLVILLDGDGEDGNEEDTDASTTSFEGFLANASAGSDAAPTGPEDLALVHFTSGTTGKPKGVMHVHEAMLAHHVSAHAALDLQPGDRYWCTADPGWVTGTSYGIVAPLTLGATLIVDEAEFDARRWYATLATERINVWYTAPTAIRMLMRAGTDLAREHNYPCLRFMASVGEPLNPEAVVWGNDAFGMPFHDNWWQTETGSIMIANRPGTEVRPGSMGTPLPGVEAAVVHPDQSAIEPIEAPDQTGELALHTPWPSMMRGYLGENERYAKCFIDGWYLTGDLVRRDVDGYFWFVSRADDVIQSAGHLISPFEVESALIAHPAVAEAGVIGLPDEVVGEVVTAYVCLHTGFEPSDEVRRAIAGHARKRLGPSVAPRTIEFNDDLPKTRSGKIMRRLLRARALGLDEGDTSTLEGRGDADGDD